MTKPKLEYILSAPKYTKIDSATCRSNTDTIARFAETMDILNSLYDNQSFGVLYNSYQEPKLGLHLKELYSDACRAFYADSGGLQIVTKGETITDELKKKIYENQASYAHYGMCFDEIPLKIVQHRAMSAKKIIEMAEKGEQSSKSVRGDYSNRVFDIEGFEIAARKTGKNINHQIKVFESLKSKCKPIAIIHGKTFEHMQRWVEYMMEEISEENQGKLGGFAISSATSGVHTLHEFRKYFAFPRLPINFNESNKHFHILGVGAITRLMPLMYFLKQGDYDGFTVSYDSSSHAQSNANGFYLNRLGKMTPFPREFCPLYEEIRRDMIDYFGVDMPMDTLKNDLITAPINSDDFQRTAIAINTYIMCSVRNFMACLQDVYLGKRSIEEYVNKKDLTFYSAFNNVNTFKEFEKVETDLLRHLNIFETADDVPATLEHMF